MPSTNPVPSQAAQDLLFNAEKLDEALSSSSLQYVDRLGASRLTLAGAVARISAVNPRGNWATATLYAARDIVLNSGTWYIALDQHTSGATFAGDQTAHWRVYQGVVSTDLDDTASASKNVGMIKLNATLNYVAGTLGARLREQVSVKDFPWLAKGDGSTDDTAAIQAAINTGLTVKIPGTASGYKVTDKITVATKDQLICGDGRVSTWLKVDSASFNMSATAVIEITSGETGPTLREFGIRFTQPDSATRASYNQYPPAIKATSQPRFIVDRMRIAQAWVGIDMKGNSGGASILGLDLFAYNGGIDIDGALDSVRIDALHCYNFDATANQIAVFYDPLNIGVKVARADDFHLHDSLFICGQALRFYASGSGTAFGNVTNTDFDTNSGIKFEAGEISAAACFCSCGAAAKQAILQTGGDLKVAASDFTCSVALTNPIVDLSANSALAPVLVLHGNTFRLSGDTSAARATNAGAGRAFLNMIGGQIQRRANNAESNASIVLGTNSRGMVKGIQLTDKGTGSGNWLSIAADEHHVIEGVAALGWGISIPSVLSLTSIRNITGLPSDFVNGYLVGNDITITKYGNLVAGAATVAHGIVAGQQKVIQAQAWYRGSGSEMLPMTVASIDGTNASLTGGSGTAAYRLTMRLTPTQQGW